MTISREVDQNYGEIIACSVTGKLNAYSGGIANSNYGSIITCWFDGTLTKDKSGAIVRDNFNTITSCYWGGNVGQGVFRNYGETVEATKVDGTAGKEEHIPREIEVGLVQGRGHNQLQFH